jgi:hypothetical protein
LPFIAELPFLALLLVGLGSSSALDASASDFAAGDGDREESAPVVSAAEAKEGGSSRDLRDPDNPNPAMIVDVEDVEFK